MRVLFTFAGGAGHLNPLLPIAATARERGHEVALTGKASVVRHAEQAGYVVLPSGAENDAGRTERGLLEPIDREREDRVLREGFAGTVARRRLAELLEVACAWGADLFVCDETDFGGTLAAECLGLPHATVLVNASGSFVRAEVLDGVFDVALLARHLVLNPFPPGFRDPRYPLPPTARGVRLHDPAPPAAADRRPRVYFTLGTIFDLESGDLFERVLAALGSLPVDAVATIGRRLLPEAVAPVPENVRVAQHIPQDELLAACDLVVSHGGSGSLLGALAYGLPVVVMPLGADQPGNADRCAATGIGRVLDAVTASPEEIAGAIADVLGNPAYRGAARLLQAELDAFASPREAVVWLEALA